MPEKPEKPLFSQRTWRLAGAAAIGCCALMAWYGSEHLASNLSPLFLLVYWGFFLLFLVVAMYMVLLDVRYILLQYKMDEREAFSSTLGSEDFRVALRRAQAAEQARKTQQDETVPEREQ